MTRGTRVRRAILAVGACLLLATGGLAAPAGAVVGVDPADRTPGFNDSVYAVVRSGSTVYVGGGFTRVTASNGTFTRRGAAAFDRRTGALLRWNPRVDGVVREIVVSRGTAYLGGTFTAVGGASRRNLASVASSGRGRVSGVAAPVNGPVLSLAVSKRRLYVGGSFSRVAGAPRANLAAVTRRAPHRLTAWRPSATGGGVRVLKRTTGGILVGGYLAELNGRGAHGKLGMVTKGSGALVRGFDPQVSVPVLDIAGDRRTIYLAAGGPRGGSVVGLARTSGRTRWVRSFDGDVAAIARGRDGVYVGGHFVTICSTNRTTETSGDCLDGGQRRERLAALRLNGELLRWNPGADSVQGVWAVSAARRADWLAVGGDFTNVGGEARQRLAVLR